MGQHHGFGRDADGGRERYEQGLVPDEMVHDPEQEGGIRSGAPQIRRPDARGGEKSPRVLGVSAYEC